MTKLKSAGVEKFTPILVLVSIALAFAVGVLWQKVDGLEGGGATGTRKAGVAAGDSGSAAQPAANPGVGRISDEQAESLAELTSDDHIRGSKDAKVTLIEYSDYECPYCGEFHSTALQVMDEYDGQVKWAYRHFPLDQIHPNARPAAVASECIAELGGNEAFWEFTDLVFADQTRLNDLESLASDVGVSASSFNDCVDSDKYADVVEEIYQTGIDAGVTGTPGNFIVNEDGGVWFVPGAYPFAQIQAYIDEALSS